MPFFCKRLRFLFSCTVFRVYIFEKSSLDKKRRTCYNDPVFWKRPLVESFSDGMSEGKDLLIDGISKGRDFLIDGMSEEKDLLIDGTFHI